MTTPGSLAPELASAIGERDLIARIRRRLPAPPVPLIVGNGDDGAVVKPERGELQVLTTDATVEGVHFERRFSTLRDVGYRALAVNVSDVAAMGGTSRLALLSLLLPPSTTIEDVEALADGVAEMALEAGVTVAGGNITRTSGPLAVDITVIGNVRPRRVLTRAGGRPGDVLYVTGTLGAAAAGLAWLREHARGVESVATDPDLARCVARYRRPRPRARIGAILGRTRAARACMDLSDGLADAARQIATASGTGVQLDAALLPIDAGARAWFGARGEDAVAATLSHGDDYELLFAVAPRSRGRLRGVMRLAQGVPMTRIGELTTSPVAVIVRDGRSEPLPLGFSHF